MKIVTANKKQKLVLSKKEWQSIGKKAGWMKMAEVEMMTDREWVCQTCGNKKNLPKFQVEMQPRKFSVGKQGEDWCPKCKYKTDHMVKSK